MRDILECTEVYTFVVAEFTITHITMVFYDLANMFRWKVLKTTTLLFCDLNFNKANAHLFPGVNVPAFSLFTIALVLHLNPFV